MNFVLDLNGVATALLTGAIVWLARTVNDLNVRMAVMENTIKLLPKRKSDNAQSEERQN